MNKVFLSGNIASSPKFGLSKNKQKYLTFSLSVFKQEFSSVKICYLLCVCFNKDVIENMKDLLKKGTTISLEGSLNWQQKPDELTTKIRNYNYSILVNKITIMEK